MIVKPAGAGKAEIVLAVLARHRASTLIVVPLCDLVYQWQRRIRQGLGVDAGLLGDRHRQVLPTTVTTYDSAYIHVRVHPHEGGRQPLPPGRLR